MPFIRNYLCTVCYLMNGHSISIPINWKSPLSESRLTEIDCIVLFFWPFNIQLNNSSLPQLSPTSPDVTDSRKGRYGWCKTDTNDANSYGFCSYSCEFPVTINYNQVGRKMMIYKYFSQNYKYVSVQSMSQLVKGTFT